MKLNFRQGIITQPNGALDLMGDNTVTLRVTDGMTTATVAFRDKNYLIDERATVDRAWGPFSWADHWGTPEATPTYYLYWDVNIVTGRLTRGFTPRVPLVSLTPPVLPSVDEHWYDLGHNQMMVWTGVAWKPVARVFAARLFTESNMLAPFATGSQVGLIFPGTLAEPVDAGYIVYDMTGGAIQLNDRTLMTTVEPVMTHHGAFSSPVRMELVAFPLITIDNMLPFTCVAPYQGQLRTAGVTPLNRPIGLAGNGALVGDPVNVVTHGIVYYDQWNWDVNAGLDLYCDQNGQLSQSTVTLPGTVNTHMGLVLGPKQIFLNVRW